VAVHVDAPLPVHPLTVAQHDKVELLDGVLVEMGPQPVTATRTSRC
jgi:hypothetical protein